MNLAFRIKLCGITSVADAQVVVAAGADAIGLNFFADSPRSVSLVTAKPIVDVLPLSICKVGVFVNHTAEEIELIARELGLDAIQIHGDEPPRFIAQLPEQLPVIRAWRLGADGLPPLATYLCSADSHGRRPDAVLIDARVEGSYGGTGTTADWSLLDDYTTQMGDTALILAGGLTPENVADAIANVRPSAVDTASGVERTPGVKDPDKVEKFVAAVRQAFAAR